MPTIYKAPVKKSSPKKTPEHGASVTHHEESSRHTRMTPLTYFAVNPAGLRFETQQEDEEVVLFLRQHFVVNIAWILLVMVLVIAPTILFPLFLTQLHLPFTIPARFILIGTIFWYIATFGFALANFLRWYFNIYIVTNERVVDIDFIHLLYKEFSEANLLKIQDVSFKTSGALAIFFNYGDVYIQTAGKMERFEFISVPQPDKVVQTIGELIEKRKGSDGV